MSSSNSPCAACKFQRRKCTQECVFAPYFPPDQPQKFENVHKVYGASNVSKILNELNPTQREDAVNSLAYDAEARLRDPVHGAVGLISILQHKVLQAQTELCNAKKELATYLGPQAMLPIVQPSAYLPQHHQGNPSSSSILPYSVLGVPNGHNQAQHHQQQQILEAQQFAAAVAVREQQQDVIRAFEPKQHFNEPPQQAQDLLRFNVGGFDPTTNSVTETGLNGDGVAPSLALGGYESPYLSNQLAAQLLISPQQTKLQQRSHQYLHEAQHQRKSEGEEGWNVGPSC